MKRKQLAFLLGLIWWDIGLVNWLLHCCINGYVPPITTLPGIVLGSAFFLLLYLLSPWVAALIGLITVLLNAVFLHILWVWGIGGFVTRFYAFFEATPDEKSGYFKLLLHEPTTAILALYIAVSIGLLLLAVWKHSSLKITEKKHRGIFYITALLLTIIPLVLRATFIYPAITTILGPYHAYHDLQSIKQRRVWLKTHTPPKENCTPYFDKIIIVIGESANRDFMSLYQHQEHETTPFLDHLAHQSPNTLLALRGLAPGNQTRLVLPLLLTPADVQHQDQFFHTFGLPSILRECGYQTFWLSNQELVGPFTMGAYSIGGEANVLRFTTDIIHDIPDQKPYDEHLLMLLSPQEIQTAQPQAFFFHLAGSHIAYDTKYPPESALYPSPQTVTERYANTIHYTDSVLERIANTFLPQSHHLLLLYVSDHGEVLLSEKKHGHGFAPAFQEEFRVPLIIWSSSPFPQIEQLRQKFQRESGLYNTAYFDDLVDYLLGIKSSLPNYASAQVIALDHTTNYYSLQYATHAESPDMPLLVLP